MHLVDLTVNFLGSTPIVGNSIPVATGTSWAEKMKKSNIVTVCYFGEAATEEGSFHESLNFAALKNLPIVYVCENNLYSVYTPLGDRQPKARSLRMLARGYGIKSFFADGNDIAAVYDVGKKAVALARSGKGPVLCEFPTYRWREHCGPNYDNNIGYRTEKEFLAWKQKDPIGKLKKTFKAAPRALSVLEKEVEEEVEMIFKGM
jgi:pyruvate dehydrogenase E1 component alpha subunit